MSKSKVKNDVILLVFILVIALAMFFIFKLSLKTGDKVIINVNGEKLYQFSLNENIEKTIETKLGKNTVEIKDGKAGIISADCPDKICRHHKAISNAGETIVCLPHKLVVEIAEEG